MTFKIRLRVSATGVDQQMKKLLDASRLHEWQNYLTFDAVKVIDRSKAEEMISHRAEVVPTQWIEVGKNEAHMDTSRAKSSADRCCYDNRREVCRTTRSSTTT